MSESHSSISDLTPWTIVHGILQARIQEWVAVSFSRGSSQPRDLTQVSHITDRFWASHRALVVKNRLATAEDIRDTGSIPGLIRSPVEGKGYPLQYSGLENSMDCIVHEVAKSQTQLSDEIPTYIKH